MLALSWIVSFDFCDLLKRINTTEGPSAEAGGPFLLFQRIAGIADIAVTEAIETILAILAISAIPAVNLKPDAPNPKPSTKKTSPFTLRKVTLCPTEGHLSQIKRSPSAEPSVTVATAMHIRL